MQKYIKSHLIVGLILIMVIMLYNNIQSNFIILDRLDKRSLQNTFDIQNEQMMNQELRQRVIKLEQLLKNK